MSILRLLVCGGLFAAGYYLGRQSCRLEFHQGQGEGFEQPEFDPEPEAPEPGGTQRQG